MPHQQLKSFQDTLFGLNTCFALSRQDLDQNPVCPHTQYRPIENQPGSKSASQILAGLDDKLDELVKQWTKTVIGNLDDPTVGANIELISDPAGKLELETLISTKSLPDKISLALVKSLQEALTGLEKVTVTNAELRAALTKGGVPCTMEELKNRFDSYIVELTKGKDSKKTRVVVE